MLKPKLGPKTNFCANLSTVTLQYNRVRFFSSHNLPYCLKPSFPLDKKRTCCTNTEPGNHKLHPPVRILDRTETWQVGALIAEHPRVPQLCVTMSSCRQGEVLMLASCNFRLDDEDKVGQHSRVAKLGIELQHKVVSKLNTASIMPLDAADYSLHTERATKRLTCRYV